MYKLYFFPDACSLAIQVVLRELDQPVELVLRDSVDNYQTINPVGSVPSLTFDQEVLREGAGILFYLLDKHANAMMPTEDGARRQAIEDILFANATMHPAYGRLLFSANNVASDAQTAALDAAAKAINHLWKVVEHKLEAKPYLGGDQPSAADILLSVYHRWGVHFPVQISVGPKTQAMLDAVQSRPSFVAALEAEKQFS